MSYIGKGVEVVTFNTATTLDVAGNITVGGTVDGRDVSTDGTKLDTIAANAIANLSEDTTPQLGGNLDLNTSNVIGTGNINVTGSITGTSFVSTGDMSFTNNSKAIFGTSPSLEIYHDGSNSILDDVGAGNFKMQLAGADKLEITSTGVDVTGTVTADGLDISGSSGATLTLTSTDTSGADTELLGQIDFVSSDVSGGSAGTQARIKGVYEDNGDSSGIAFLTGFSTGSGTPTLNEVMRIRHEGRVGIGTTNITSPFVVNTAFNSGYISQFVNTGTGSDPNGVLIQAGVVDSAYILRLTKQDATDVLAVRGSGSVGISKTAYGSISTDGFWWENGVAKYLALSGTGTSPLYLNRNGSDGGIVNFYKSGTNVGRIGAKGGDLTLGTGAIGVRFEDSSNSIVPFDTSSAGSTDNDVDLGKSSVRFKDLYLGGGIQFDSRSNKLDDYEEGNWTPGISAASGSGGTTGGVGRYTKIGNQVIIAGHITPTNMGSLSGTFYVTGLPFTSRNQFIQSQGAVRSQGIGGTNHQSVSFEVLQASQNGRFHFHSSTGAQLVVQASDISVGDFVAFGLTYEV